MMKDAYDNRGEIEQQLKGAFDDYALHADEFVWDNIQEALQPEKKRRAALWFWGAAASVAGLIVLFSVYQFNNSNTDPVTKNEQMISEEASVQNEKPVQSEQPVLAEDNLLTDDKVDAVEENTITEKIVTDSPSTEGTSTYSIGMNGQKSATVIVESDDPIRMNLDHMALREGEVVPTIREREMETRYLLLGEMKPEKEQKPAAAWALAANFGSSSQTSGSEQFGASPGTQEAFFDLNSSNSLQASTMDLSNQEATYHPPIVTGLRVNRAISKRWSLETGLSYTLLSGSSKYDSGTEQTTYRTRIHYIGIPLLANFSFINKKRFRMYSSQGFMLDKGVGQQHSFVTVTGGNITNEYQPKGKAPGLQGAVVLGLGADYKVGKRTSIYMQPSVSSWLLNLKQGPNGRNERLLWPSMQMGVRLDI